MNGLRTIVRFHVRNFPLKKIYYFDIYDLLHKTEIQYIVSPELSFAIDRPLRTGLNDRAGARQDSCRLSHAANG